MEAMAADVLAFLDVQGIDRPIIFGHSMGGRVTLTTARAEIEARALVTDRFKPLRAGGRTIHVIGLPYHFSYVGRITGDPASSAPSAWRR